METGVTEVSVKRVTPRKVDASNLKYKVYYRGKQADTTGVGGTWDTSGLLLELFEVGRQIVGMSLLPSKPVLVCPNDPTCILDAVKEFSRCKNVKYIS